MSIEQARVPGQNPIGPAEDASSDEFVDQGDRQIESDKDDDHRRGAESPGGKAFESDESDEGDRPSVWRVLTEFHNATGLTDADQSELLRRRGLTAEVSAALGFATNDRVNRDVLVNLAQSACEELVLKAGLWVKPEGEKAKPNAQFYGWGVIGKAPKSDEIQWGWKEDGKCNPILIPYFNEHGQVEHIRPHKGMTKDGSPRLWVARDPKDTAPPEREVAVIFEGEFKGAAVWQVLRDQVAVASIPGITMSKHWLVQRQLGDWLNLVKPKVVIIAFDNEEKGDPALPGFKVDPRKRYDAETWARYLAETLRRGGFTAKVARLPNEWRDAKGKADWDGVLAQRMGTLRELDGDLLHAARVRIRDDFWRVLSEARPISELGQGGPFDAQAEQIIRARVAKLCYARKLPVGGRKEFDIARKLRRSLSALKYPSGDKSFLKHLAESYCETKDRHYTLKPLRDVKHEEWMVRLNLARAKNDPVAEWVCGIALNGLPKVVSNFHMEGLIILIRPDGKRDRMVRIDNVHHEVRKMVPWDARSMSRPSDFREWLANCGNLVWMGNERDLQALQQDLSQDLAFQEVVQLVAYGSNQECGLWFYGDCAVGTGPAGERIEIKPDELGIYWWNGKGYYLGPTGKENQTFRQGVPMLHPELEIRDLGIRPETFKLGSELVPNPTTDEELFPVFLRETCERLRLSVGGFEAYLAVSIVLAYAAAPELFAKYGQFPGLWVGGQTSSGKTTLVSLLLEFFGFHGRESGLGLKSFVTAVGLQIALEQYSNLPLWADEYENDQAIQESLKGVIHASFNREIPSKWNVNGEMRIIRTNLIVSGETTPGRAATRSRFAQMQLAVEKRLGTKSEQLENWTWLREHRGYFFVFGREAMRRRREFTEALLASLRQWMEAPDVKGVEERTKFVYGVAYASFKAMLNLWETHGAKEFEGYRQFLKGQCVEAVENVNASINANRFWSDLMSAFTAGAFGFTKDELTRYFKVKSDWAPHPPMAQNQGPWNSHKLFFKLEDALSVVRTFLRRQGLDFPLTDTDLRNQLRARPYWVSSAVGHRQTFGHGAAQSRCHCIDVDKHEMGYQLVQDDVLEEARRGSDGSPLNVQNLSDPRKGELFQIIEALQRDAG